MTGCCGCPQTGLVLVQDLSEELPTVSSPELQGAGAPWVWLFCSHLSRKQRYNRCPVKTDPFPKCSLPVTEKLCKVSGARRKTDLEKRGEGTAERGCSLGAETARVGCAARRVSWQSSCSQSSKAVTHGARLRERQERKRQYFVVSLKSQCGQLGLQVGVFVWR